MIITLNEDTAAHAAARDKTMNECESFLLRSCVKTTQLGHTEGRCGKIERSGSRTLDIESSNIRAEIIEWNGCVCIGK